MTMNNKKFDEAVKIAYEESLEIKSTMIERWIRKDLIDDLEGDPKSKDARIKAISRLD